MIVPGNTIKLVDVGTSIAVLPEAESQSPVVKAVRNIKKKNAGAFIRLQPTTSQTDKTNTQKESGNATSGRGVVYLSHIPDGFYEDEMRQYFSQFGRVTRVKLARSRKTGRSRGYAFIEFQYAEVAKVVAETMNNYLLYNRLLKASYMDKQYPAAFWNQQSCGPQNCPLARNRRIEIKRKNAILDPAKELAQQGRRRRRLAKTLNRLRDAGVDHTLEVKDQVELSTRGKKIGGAKNTKQEKQASEESVKVEEDSRNSQPVLLVDESDDEIEFNVPSFVIRKTLKRRSSSPALEQSPKVKRGKHVKSEPLTSPTQEALSSPEKQNGEASSRSNHKSRKSGRVSVIPKHISSGFHVTITPGKSKQNKLASKENRESQSPVQSEESPKQLGTPKAVDAASPRLSKSVESSTNKKIRNSRLSTENKIDGSPENTEIPKVHRRSTETPEILDGVTPTPVADSAVRKVSPKAVKTPKQMKNNPHTIEKRKTPKLMDVRGSVASGPEKTVLLKSNGKRISPKATPNVHCPVQKLNSVDRSPLKTPVGRKSLPLSKPNLEDKKRTGLKTPLKTPIGRKSQNWTASSGPNRSPNLMQKLGSEDKKRTGLKTPLKTPVGRKSQNWTATSGPKHSPKLMQQLGSEDKKRTGLKTPSKTPIGRKSQNWTAASSPKRSPLSHSTALKKHDSASPKASKPARKSLKLNK
ncbi:serine/arginine repetitive matrix protein 1 [Schistocerca americana]|uniref:serine/arginine repetitive matrix protein 1 n=1 Tax=Schistocerca americana TaxID=7009 RepID=UPI001F4F4EED|nr:serine/arginine repetitive matrix protein 1 [Schistocerca americana]